MKEFLKKTWKKMTGNQDPAEVEWEIHVRLQGISVWTLCGRRQVGLAEKTAFLEGSILKVKATAGDMDQFMRAGSCLRGLPGDMTMALRAGQKVRATLKDLLPYLRQGARDM